MSADEQSCCEIGKDHYAEQDVEPFDDLAGGQKRRCDDEQHRRDIERQQGIAKTDAAWRRASIKPADAFSQGAEGHARCSPIQLHHCKLRMAATLGD